jgi:hypothetical protein
MYIINYGSGFTGLDFKPKPVTSPLNRRRGKKTAGLYLMASPDSNPPSCPDNDPKITAFPKPSSVPQEQGDLPDLTSLELIATDPATACHGGPIQQDIAGVGQAESGGPQDRRVEDSAVAPADDNGASYNDANCAAPSRRI